MTVWNESECKSGEALQETNAHEKSYLFAGTPGIQCLAMSAPFPFRMSTELQLCWIHI